MAFSSVLRRAASRVVPVAIRTAAGSQRCLHYYRHVCSSPMPAVGRSLGVVMGRPFPGSLFRYSTKGNSDEALLKVVDSEIKCALESREEEAGDTPPDFPFKIEDQPGQRIVTLQRHYQGEDITVEVHMPDLVTGEEDDKREDEEEDDDETETSNSSSLPLVVRVAKGNKPVLEFGCTAYADDIAIESLSFKDPENAEDQIAYEGPDFGDLDENLQKAFQKYLETRGITTSTTNFLYEYMLEKEDREYLTWLKNLQKFVQA